MVQLGGTIAATRDLAVIGIRLIAFYLIARGIVVLAQSAPYFWADGASNGQPLLYATVAIQIIAPLALGALMWVSASWLAGLVVRGRTAPMDLGDLSAESVAATAFGVAGIVILIHSLPQLFVTLVTVWEVSRQGGVGPMYSQWLQPAAIALRCVLAFGVMVGARTIARWLLAARKVGLYRGDR